MEKKLTENQRLSSPILPQKPRFGLFCLSTSGLLIRFRFYEQFHIIDPVRTESHLRNCSRSIWRWKSFGVITQTTAYPAVCPQRRTSPLFGKRHRLHVIRHHTHLLRNIADIDIRHLIASQSLFHLGDLPILLVQQLHITRLQRLQIDLIRVRCLSHHQFCRGSPWLASCPRAFSITSSPSGSPTSNNSMQGDSPPRR